MLLIYFDALLTPSAYFSEDFRAHIGDIYKSTLKDVILILNNLRTKANKRKLRRALSFKAIVGNLRFSSAECFHTIVPVMYDNFRLCPFISMIGSKHTEFRLNLDFDL